MAEKLVAVELEEGRTFAVPFNMGRMSPKGGFACSGVDTLTITTYICPKCDQTHLDIISLGTGIGMLTTLPTTLAEKIAYAILNPKPAEEGSITPFDK